MSKESILLYIQKTEYDYGDSSECDAAASVGDEIYCNIDMINNVDDLDDWIYVLLNRATYLEELAAIYRDAASKADSKVQEIACG